MLKKTLYRHVFLATLTGVLVGVTDGVVAAFHYDIGIPLGVSITQGMVAVSLLGFLWGCGQALIVVLYAAIPRSANFAPWFDRYTTRDRTRPRRPVVWFHALAVVGLAVLTVYLVILAVFFHQLWTLQVEGFARFLIIVYAGLGLPMAAASIYLLTRLLLPVLQKIDDTIGLPYPPQPGLRFLVFVGIPATTICIVSLVEYEQYLGSLAWFLWIALFLVAEGAVHYLWNALPKRICRSSGYVRGLSITWSLVVIAVTFGVLGENRLGLISPVAKRCTTVLWSITDFDGDGVSSFLGGGDCAPFDENIHPAAYDVPGNSVDEDCSGEDAKHHPSHDQRRFWSGNEVTRKHYNVVWFIIESTRADATSLHSTDIHTTPYLRKLAEESLVFGRAFSQSSGTRWSLASMFVGQNPASVVWTTEGYPQLAESNVTLAERLKEVGYQTAMVTGTYALGSMRSHHQGFDVLKSPPLVGKDHWSSSQSAPAVSLALRLLQERQSITDGDKPFFLAVFLTDPHAPYISHKEAFPQWGTENRQRYLGEVAFVDRNIAFFTEYLRADSSLWDNTVLVITSDHGEAFGEHGQTHHHKSCYQEESHVPLLVRIPGVEAQHIDIPVAHIDIAPTLLDVLGVPPGNMKLQGQSLLIPAYGPGSVDPKRPIFCMLFGRGVHQRSVRVGHHVLFHFPLEDRYELYDQMADKGETKNLLATDQDFASIFQELRTRLEETPLRSPVSQ